MFLPKPFIYYCSGPSRGTFLPNWPFFVFFEIWSKSGKITKKAQKKYVPPPCARVSFRKTVPGDHIWWYLSQNQPFKHLVTEPPECPLLIGHFDITHILTYNTPERVQIWVTWAKVTNETVKETINNTYFIWNKYA